MPKILIIDATQVNFGDDRGGQHVDECETVDVTKDTAAKLVGIGRALYTEKKDDPSKGALNTASAAQLKAAAAVVKERAKQPAESVVEPSRVVQPPVVVPPAD